MPPAWYVELRSVRDLPDRSTAYSYELLLGMNGRVPARLAGGLLGFR